MAWFIITTVINIPIKKIYNLMVIYKAQVVTPVLLENKIRLIFRLMTIVAQWPNFMYGAYRSGLGALVSQPQAAFWLSVVQPVTFSGLSLVNWAFLPLSVSQTLWKFYDGELVKMDGALGTIIRLRSKNHG